MKIDVTIPDGKNGDWEISSFTINKSASDMYNLQQLFNGQRRYVQPGEYKKLTYKGTIVMSNTPTEINDHVLFINQAMKDKTVLINGLGLGVALKKLQESSTLKEIIVIELDKEVISLIAPHFKDDSRIKIIREDALKYTPEKGKKFDSVWHDIWSTINDENIPDMCKLHRKYGKRTKWQGSWCRYECERMRRESKRNG